MNRYPSRASYHYRVRLCRIIWSKLDRLSCRATSLRQYLSRVRACDERFCDEYFFIAAAFCFFFLFLNASPNNVIKHDKTHYRDGSNKLPGTQQFQIVRVGFSVSSRARAIASTVARCVRYMRRRFYTASDKVEIPRRKEQEIYR